MWLLVYLLALHVLFWSTQCVGIYADSLGQLPSFKMDISGIPPYFPPGYPMLVGIAYLVWPSAVGFLITMIQHLMMVAVVWWCFRLLQSCVGAPLALAAALVIGASAPSLALPQSIMSANVALFGMAGALYFAVRYSERGVLRDAVMSGVLLAWATMARIAPFPAVLPAIFVGILGADRVWVGLRRFATIGAGALLVIAVPIVWFGVNFGTYTLARSFGHHLYDRVMMDEDLLNRSAPETAQFLKVIAPVDPRGIEQWRMQKILTRKGLDWDESDTLMREVAWDGIRHAPLKYIKSSLEHASNMYFSNPAWSIPWWSIPGLGRSPELESAPLLGVRANSLLWRKVLNAQFAVVWEYVPWLALAGLCLLPLLRKKMVLLGFALIPFGYLIFTALIASPLARYELAVVPFVLALVVVPFFAAKSLLERARCTDGPISI